MVDVTRARKMADRIKVIVAKRLEKGLRDPRLGFVTITDVRVTGDLQNASIFFTVYGSDQERADSAEALAAATGLLRREVGRHLSVRFTPTLEFFQDALPEGVAHMDELLARAKQHDAEVADAASTAQYAGDPDPYAKDDDDEDSAGTD